LIEHPALRTAVAATGERPLGSAAILMDRRVSTDGNGNGRFGLDGLSIDPGSGRIEGAGGQEQVDPKVMEVLVALARHPGELVTREHLLDEVWRDRVVSDETLTHCVYQLRGHLEAAGGEARFRNLIKTLPKRGYRLDGKIERIGPDSGAGRTAAPAKRSRAGIFIGLFVAIAASAGGFLAFEWMGSGGNPPSPANSIAVLPFDDFSPNGDQAYLADGFAEEMIDRLSRIPGLRVIARTSSFSFRDKVVDIPEIARKLGVNFVLEGSIRKHADRIRITTQLIDTRNSSHVWSNSYDRQLTDILGVQAEIAGSVADALHLTLADVPSDFDRSPVAPKAYEHYLLARYFFNRRASGDVELAARHYEQAVEIDPEFAQAWVGLAAVSWLRSDDAARRGEWMEKMGMALQKALAINPHLPEAHGRACAYYWTIGDQDRADRHWRLRADRHWRLALEYGAETELILGYAASRAMTAGDYDRALELQGRALEKNPLSAIAHGNHAYFLMSQGRFPAALEAFDRSEQLSPGLKANYQVPRAFILVLTGRSDEAADRARQWPDGPDRDQVLAMANIAMGQTDAAETAMRRLMSRPGADIALRMAETEAFRGDADAAFEWLRRITSRTTEAERQRTWPSWEVMLRLSPSLRVLRDDMRWEAAIRTLPDAQPIALTDAPLGRADDR